MLKTNVKCKTSMILENIGEYLYNLEINNFIRHTVNIDKTDKFKHAKIEDFDLLTDTINFQI